MPPVLRELCPESKNDCRNVLNSKLESLAEKRTHLATPFRAHSLKSKHQFPEVPFNRVGQIARRQRLENDVPFAFVVEHRDQKAVGTKIRGRREKNRQQYGEPNSPCA